MLVIGNFHFRIEINIHDDNSLTIIKLKRKNEEGDNA